MSDDQQYKCRMCGELYNEWLPVCPKCKSGRVYVVVSDQEAKSVRREPSDIERMRHHHRP